MDGIVTDIDTDIWLYMIWYDMIWYGYGYGYGYDMIWYGYMVTIYGFITYSNYWYIYRWWVHE